MISFRFLSNDVSWERALYNVGLWCNGSTDEFESFSLGSSPSGPSKGNCGVVQLVEHLTVNQVVAGSSPASTATLYLEA